LLLFLRVIAVNPALIKQTPWPIVHKWTKPTDRPPLVSEI
jgi:hypothetical protein